mmetsp:Transcript_74690/g.146600  ORF Transcript_74690/g.146600 Transcript_74690/m.146600 type:complete len:815 (+) Transcript_74690:62-2506(+)|eukprot:CAMPEP_0170213916 /NCGR_PEP_ID=MMETSP0116_2-20130129/6584_1 /TAXON_ID=400756 /ORGANISM="Durinskia baltica, Strain CSIRO CS-38" /LENGTH=814 /DNA_ID=CAMNT_0010464471 /DNA_START=246 /DNA_END=2690 /DNA_ORIENTATION=-
MARKDDGDEIGVNDSTTAMPALDSNAARAVSSHMSSHAVNALQSLLGGQQLSFLDPNVVMVTNAAAAIAAVAASASQQLNRGSTPPAPQPGSAVASLPPALLASLRNVGVNQTQNVSVPPPIVSLLAAAAGAGGGHHGLQLQGSQSTPVSAHLQQLLSHPDSSKLHSSSTPAPLPVGVASKSSSHSGMQSWTLEQLEKHVSLLQQMKQPIPQSVALLLADAQRKEKKKTAKRAANRKSASTSRARKKALVEEMARTNARLRRQALILALLPDLVVATNLDGEISFCSAQVERILGHKAEDLIGAPLDTLLVPSSRDTLHKLFNRLISPGQARSSRQAQSRRGTKRRHNHQDEEGAKQDSKGIDGTGGEAPCRGSSQSGDANSGNSATTSGAAIISEQSFPLSVVEVDSKQRSERRDDISGDAKASNPNENSDNSTSNNSGIKQPVSSLSNATGLRSPAECPSEDDGAQGGSEGSKRAKTSEKGKQQNSSDDSSLSSEAKNMRNANDNLDRNVRWHNQRMMGDIQKTKSDDGPKDDVTGASVTANNASARLSSLKHVPNTKDKKGEKSNQYENDQSSSDDSLLAGVEEKKKVGNNSDDSGYRESNDSREETSSSGSDSSNVKNRRKPIAPTCRLCLIRSDLTTVWCEVTSSLRTRKQDEDPLDLQLGSFKGGDSVTTEPIKKEAEQEFLLCFRPMRDGEKKADESLRFVSTRTNLGIGAPPEVVVSTSGNDSNSQKGSSDKNFGDDSDSKLESNSSGTPQPQPKKRQAALQNPVDSLNGKAAKRSKTGEPEGTGRGSDDTEKSVVESLMLMNKSQ